MSLPHQIGDRPLLNLDSVKSNDGMSLAQTEELQFTVASLSIKRVIHVYDEMTVSSNRTFVDQEYLQYVNKEVTELSLSVFKS